VRLSRIWLVVLAACGSETSKPAGTPPVGSGSAAPAPVVQPDAAPALPRTTRAEKVRAQLPDLGSIQRVVVQPDGAVLVVGEDGIARLDSDLALDQAFGIGGVVKLELREAKLQTATVDDRGRIIVVGHVWSKKRAENLLVARLTSRGALDASFGEAGISTRDFGDTDDRPSGVFVMPSGDIVVIGSHQQAAKAQHYNSYLVTIDRQGKPKGRPVFFDCIPKSREFITRVLRVEGGFVVAGYAYNATPEESGVYIARVSDDGKLDPTFGEGGVQRVRGGDIGRAVAWELAPAKNGDFLLGGQDGETIEKYRGYVMRFAKQGALVDTWGKHGIAWAPLGVQWISMALDEESGVLGVSRFDGALVRFDARGDIDRNFGTNGIVSGHDDDTFDNGAALPDGDVIVVGDKLLVRYGPPTTIK
jgi:uncharacterized delta-60 repeat protein